MGEFSYGPFVYFNTLPAIVEARKTSFKSDRNKERKVLIIKNKEKASPIVSRDSLSKDSNADRLKEVIDYQKFLNKFNDEFRRSDYILDEVVVSTNLKSKEEIRAEEMNKRTSYGEAFRRIDVKNQISSRATAIDLFYSVPGVNVIRDSIYIKNVPNMMPLILCDEMPIDIIDLSIIDASEISFIDILTGPEATVFTSLGAVVSIYSNEGNGSGLNITQGRKPGIIDFEAIGFYTAREYYPADPNDIEMQFKKDPRTTLHWEPKIKIKNNETIDLSFYTSDFDSKYIIEIQGITKNGTPIYKTKTFTVE